MSAKEIDLQTLVGQIRDRSSSKRRAAAKHLRRLANPEAGPALLQALRSELQDARTWETQYQMVMALAHCGFREALPLLMDLSKRSFKHTMVLTAVGDALVRLGRATEHDSRPLIAALGQDCDWCLSDGALRATAMLQLRFDRETCASIVESVRSKPMEALQFWAVAACAGWSGPAVGRFVESCLLSSRADIREAAELAKRGAYKKWNPL